jgi:hypothetical protein
MRALDQLVPAWRRRDMSLVVKVVSDWPTRAGSGRGQVGAEVVPSGGDLVGALSTARLVVAPVNHGTSALSWVPAAMAAGTPWLSTEKAPTGARSWMGSSPGRSCPTSPPWATGDGRC